MINGKLFAQTFFFPLCTNRSVPSPILISGTSSRASTRFCRYLKGLSKKQVDICRESREYMAPILSGANMAIKECRTKFQFSRWNCSVPGADKGSIFERITGRGKQYILMNIINTSQNSVSLYHWIRTISRYRTYAFAIRTALFCVRDF